MRYGSISFFLSISLCFSTSLGLGQVIRNKAADAPKTTPRKLDSLKAPDPLSREEPECPPEAIRTGLRGIVRCRVTVNEKGEVYEAEGLVGHPWTRQPALNAIIRWKFKPLLVNGEPKPFIRTVTVAFECRQ